MQVKLQLDVIFTRSKLNYMHIAIIGQPFS